MISAISPNEVVEHQRRHREEAIEEYVARINAHLRNHEKYPGGHWCVAKIVPMEFRQAVAKRFTDAGWSVSYSSSNEDYADYFNLEPMATNPRAHTP